MTAVIGVSFLSLAAIIFAWAYGQYRRPDPRAWTRAEVPTYAVTLITIALFTLGIGYTADALINLGAEPPSALNGLQIAGALALAGILVPRLVRPARAGAAGAETVPPTPESAVVLPHPAVAGGPDTTPRPSEAGGGGKKPRRRRAA